MHTHEPPIGLYIHVPFCASKCPYCDFYSIALDDALADAYTQRICHLLRHHPFGKRAADTIYFGGGTPTLLGAKRLDAILQAAGQGFSLSPQAEITLEANPASALLPLLRLLRQSGFNRISFGIQSMHDDELQALGRRHSAQEAQSAVLDAHTAGFENISGDLMLGIPLQTVARLQETLQAFSLLPLQHVSAYLLKVEKHTPFAAYKLDLPDEDALAEYYLACAGQLEAYGFAQYEISNFAKPGAQSQHNLKYWRCQPYLGIGPAAHSFLDGERFAFSPSLSAFLEPHKPFTDTVTDGAGGGFEEEAMLRLRLCEGFDATYFAALYQTDASRMLAKAAQFAQHGLLSVRDGTISLTPRGFLLSSSIIADLLYAS